MAFIASRILFAGSVLCALHVGIADARTITLAADGQSLSATITTQAPDAADNVVQMACGAETGVRIG